MMRNIFYLAIGFVILNGCSKNDSLDEQIIGKWQLIKSESYNWTSHTVIDYSDENIIYNFKANGLLNVSGGEDAGISNTEVEYETVFEYQNEIDTHEKQWFVYINSIRSSLDINDNSMTINRASTDGATLSFKRKK